LTQLLSVLKFNNNSTRNTAVTDHDQDQSEVDHRLIAASEFTKMAVEFLAAFEPDLGKNQSLGVIIEALSETLGNVISLVKDDHQQEVIDTANLVIQQGILSQHELIAEISYGQIGHA
jgi:hypothetical protein